ncbi:MAG: hypothetical protein GC158_02715 [Cyanobacteria bacterium RI_101]|nr:hypothetical protein [Cyanobacteria bacterium RI_101]
MTIDIEAAERFGWQRDGEILEVRSDLILEDWPDKQAQDLGMVYTAFIGAGDCEAVTVVLTWEDGAVRIRSLEWGRP